MQQALQSSPDNGSTMLARRLKVILLLGLLAQALLCLINLAISICRYPIPIVV